MSMPQILEQDLAGKNALVTGASRGIGRAIALHLASRGASVIGTCSSPQSLHLISELKETISTLYKSSSHAAPRIVGLPANLLDNDTPEKMAEAVEREYSGKLHILVNNAAYDETRPIGELDAEYVQRSLAGNIQTLVLSMDLFFKKTMFQPNSRIVNISSELTRGHLSHPAFALLAATKAAMESLTRTWADMFGTHPSMLGTTVNALLAGATDTDAFLKGFSPEQRKAVLDRLLPRVSVGPRIAAAEDIADLVGLLVSERARWISGSVVGANGGTVKVL